jgi:hypothetical protein
MNSASGRCLTGSPPWVDVALAAGSSGERGGIAMTMCRMRASVLCIGLLLCGAAVADDDHGGKAKAKLYLPVGGGTADGSVTFAGTVSVQKFVQVDGKVFAVAMVSGSASSAGGPAGSVLAGPVLFPVNIEPGSPIVRSAAAAPQQATNCQVLHLDLGAVNLNVLGFQIATQPISIDVSGVTGGTNVLGQLLCTILETVGNVIGLVNLLNQLLGTLGGLTG